MNRSNHWTGLENGFKGASRVYLSSNAAINSIATSYYSLFAPSSRRTCSRLTAAGKRTRLVSAAAKRGERRSTGQMTESEIFPLFTNSRIHSMSPAPHNSPPRSHPTSQRVSPSRTPSIPYLPVPASSHGMSISPLPLPKPKPSVKVRSKPPRLPVYQTWKKRLSKEKHEETCSPWAHDDDYVS